MMKTASTLALMLLAGACTTDNVVASPVPAFRETAGMGMTGDAADDPAIWVHPTDTSKSLILGTNKDVGVYVYGLDGSEKQRLPVWLVSCKRVLRVFLKIAKVRAWWQICRFGKTQ